MIALEGGDGKVFLYGEKELAYLKKKDKRLGQVIGTLGLLERNTDSDLFASVVRHIVGQQISVAAQATIWRRMTDAMGAITPEKIYMTDVATLQAYGITFKKAEYIKDFAQRVHNGTFDVEALSEKSDAAVITELSALKGIGVWTAEMLMIFCMQRPDVLSYGDLAIHRGLRMLYHHRKIDRTLFEKYRRRYSPYGSVASFYIWAVSNGAISGMKDYAPPKKAKGT
ncbi:MAG TPA: DNA-3-methyladenine glycosylase 2 family protein [Clostridia bacterium]|nr:DNA-3-methyladenine glycosylase 2 family protein [Clostridia bacterium]